MIMIAVMMPRRYSITAGNIREMLDTSTSHCSGSAVELPILSVCIVWVAWALDLQMDTNLDVVNFSNL